MATPTHTLPIFLLSLLFLTTSATAAATAATTNNYIKSKCSSTAYPTACVQTLSSFGNKIQNSPRQLAQIALTVSLAKARYAKQCVAQVSHTKGLRPREVGVIRDCMEEIGDTVDRLSKSVHEFQIAARSRSKDFMWHMSNVQTWASAALTDVNTCMDGYNARVLNWRTKSAMKAPFQDVMQCTSNALALVNQFANKYSP